MADRKVLYINAEKRYEEHSESADSIKMLSLKTASKELTDTKLGKLIDGADAADEHLHDGRYYRENEHVSSSSGSADASKPIILGADGKLDESFLDDADIAHDSTSGAAASTVHTAFPLLVGGRDFTAIQEYDSAKNFAGANDAAIPDKKYVDDKVASAGTASEWQDSCLDILLTPPASPASGDRYLINGAGTGAWSGQDYDIAQWNGSSWDFTTPTTGTFVSVDDVTDGLYYFGGAGPWVLKNFEITTASLGCEKVGSDIRLDLKANGGLTLDGNEAQVDAQDFDGEGLIANSALDLAIDWSSTYDDSKAIKASDLSSNANSKGASIIGIEDSAGNFSATDVEGALAEAYSAAVGGGYNTFTAGAGGVSKGDLLYVSANDTVLPMPINAAHECVGMALEDAAESAEVKAVMDSRLLSGVLSGMTLDVGYYWTGSTWSSTAPSGSGEYIWRVGTPKNATTMSVNVEYNGKNS